MPKSNEKFFTTIHKKTILSLVNSPSFCESMLNSGWSCCFSFNKFLDNLLYSSYIAVISPRVLRHRVQGCLRVAFAIFPHAGNANA